MTGDALLARLMAQAEGRGVDLITLRALVEEASQAGATRALGALGLDDPRARRDMDELRELLSAWRDAKRSARQAVVSWAGEDCSLLRCWLEWRSSLGCWSCCIECSPAQAGCELQAERRFGPWRLSPCLRGEAVASRAMPRSSTGRTGAAM